MGRLKAPQITGAKNLSEGQKRKRKRKNTFAKLDQRLRTLKEKEEENPFETKINKSKFKVVQKKEQSSYNIIKAKENALKLVSFYFIHVCFSFTFIHVLFIFCFTKQKERKNIETTIGKRWKGKFIH